MKDVMLDLETMDNSATSAIVTVGAIEFNPCTGETGQEFYRIVDLQSCIDKGLTLNAGTIYWWLTQNKPAREEIVDSKREPLEEVCKSFINFCKSISNNDLNTDRGTYPDIRVWGNGATFDNAIFRYAFSRCNMPFPADFWNDRDVRTVVGFYPTGLWQDYRKNNMRSGYHNALEDSKYQVQYMSHIIKELGVEEIY